MSVTLEEHRKQTVNELEQLLKIMIRFVVLDLQDMVKHTILQER